jgi:alkanesulfonate monooxygenase SsuD/methylene tetrahydromethanopterin reductase-like flavin-dependent oxidoreductase (luciferase family)
VYCGETEQEAYDTASRHMAEYGDSSTRHYKLRGDHFAKLKDYDHYAKISQALREGQASADPSNVYLDNHVWGTPEQCIEKLRAINEQMGVDELIAVMSYGSMAVEVAEKSMRLFAREVLPAAHEIAPAPVPA